MELNINSPAYYTKVYGVDDEVYWMCREISKIVKDRNYSDKINIVGLMPVAAPKELTDNGAWKEEIKFDWKYQLVIVCKHIDYDKYISANIEGKKRLMLDNILSSVKSISTKAKLNYMAFEKDVLEDIAFSSDDEDNQE